MQQIGDQNVPVSTNFKQSLDAINVSRKQEPPFDATNQAIDDGTPDENF